MAPWPDPSMSCIHDMAKWPGYRMSRWKACVWDAVGLRPAGPMQPSTAGSLASFPFPKGSVSRAGLSALSFLSLHTHLRKAYSFQGLQQRFALGQSPLTGTRGDGFKSRLLHLFVLRPWEICWVFLRLVFCFVLFFICKRRRIGIPTHRVFWGRERENEYKMLSMFFQRMLPEQEMSTDNRMVLGLFPAP